MEEIEFSVDISDQDWQCFFTQCEECNVLPAALAGLEDSGMSDMDDLGTVFCKRVPKCEIETYHSEEAVADGPPVCEGSPQELYLGKHHSGGMESVLSGSEEDIHLQSVNVFFEQMKSPSHCQKPVQQNQVVAIKNRPVKGELSRDGQSASFTGCALLKNIPKLNSARGVAAAGIKTTERVSIVCNAHSVITDESSSESSTALYVKHPYLKTKLYIESSSENTANEKIEHHNPLSKTASSTPHSNTEKQMCMCDVKDYSAHQKPLDLRRNPGLVGNGKWTEDKSTQVSQSDSESPYKLLSKESSPCASIKRKRRKKRRLSVEPAESLFGHERPYSSEDELFTWRRAIDPCFSKDFSWSGLKHQQVKCGFIPPLGQYKLSSSLPAGVEAEEIRMEVPLLSTSHRRQHESLYTQDNFGPAGFTKVRHSTESDVKNDVTKFSGNTNGDNASEQELTKVKEAMKVKETHLEGVASSNNTYKNGVKSITDAIFQSAESADPGVAMDRSVRVSSAKLVMREEAETEKASQCQRATKPQQQLETQCPITYQSLHMVENMTPLPNETAMSTVTELLDHTTRQHASRMADTASEEAGAIMHNHSPIYYDLIMNCTVLKTQNDAKADLSPKHEITTVCEDGTAQDKDGRNQIESGKMQQSELQARFESENRLHFSSYSTVSSCHTPETEPNVLLSNENVTQRLENTCTSRNGNLQEENKQIIPTNGKINTILKTECPQLSHDAEVEPCWDRVEVVMTNSQSDDNTEPGVKSDHTVFAMSSFWKEMEKLTINDILGCKKEKKFQSSFLPSLQENDNCFTLSDSGCCSQAEERKLGIPDPVDCNLSSAMTSDSSSRGVLWECEPVPMSLPPENIDTITVNGITEHITTSGLRRMSKKISVQNLRALESDSFGYKCNSQSTIKPLDEDTCKDIGYIPDDPVPKRDLRPSSMIENFKLSLTDIYSYFFSEKQSDTSLQSPTENIVNNFTDGDSVPENYDHFFSEFDTDSFFYTDEVKPELVPIFSCSRSSKSKMGFHDAYDYFLVSSSDNSSSESDEEDQPERGPFRVVTRFTRKASSKDVVTDAYEQFYTDRDLQQDFFKTTFSFRNTKLTDYNVHKEEPANTTTVEPLKHESSSLHNNAMPITVLGNQDVLFPDSRLCNDEQIITKLQQPLIYQNLQTAVANPNLDAPLLPLRQSDMCLICIAFASWVLKTADPQAGDAWKAVLLANVSALSAIRYLRRYVKGEKKPNLKALCS